MSPSVILCGGSSVYCGLRRKIPSACGSIQFDHSNAGSIRQTLTAPKKATDGRSPDRDGRPVCTCMCALAASTPLRCVSVARRQGKWPGGRRRGAAEARPQPGRSRPDEGAVPERNGATSRYRLTLTLTCAQVGAYVPADLSASGFRSADPPYVATTAMAVGVDPASSNEGLGGHNLSGRTVNRALRARYVPEAARHRGNWRVVADNATWRRTPSELRFRQSRGWG